MDREPTEMERAVSEDLRAVCLKEFGSTWSYDVAWKFARAAIRAMREPTPEMSAEMMNTHGPLSRGQIDPMAYWEMLIDAASPPEREGAK